MKETILYSPIKVFIVTCYKQYSLALFTGILEHILQYFSLRYLLRRGISGFRVCISTKQFFKFFLKSKGLKQLQCDIDISV